MSSTVQYLYGCRDDVEEEEGGERGPDGSEAKPPVPLEWVSKGPDLASTDIA